jgi:HEAT repeat protein
MHLEEANRAPDPGTRGTILPFLLENLQDPNPRVRVLAVRQLSDCSDGQVIRRLMELAQDDPSTDVRCAAIAGLGNFIYMGGFSAYDPETDQEVACPNKALSKQDLDRVYTFLLSLYHDKGRTLDERRQAVEAESFFSNDTVEDLIAELYARPEKSAKMSALIAMGRNGSLRWVEVLEKELYSSDRDLQLEAINAAGEMSLEGLGKDLWRLTYSEDQEVMLAAIWSLGQTGWDGAFERLDELTLSPDPRVREIADEAMEEWLFFNGLESAYAEDREDDLLGED